MRDDQMTPAEIQSLLLEVAADRQNIAEVRDGANALETGAQDQLIRNLDAAIARLAARLDGVRVRISEGLTGDLQTALEDVDALDDECSALLALIGAPRIFIPGFLARRLSGWASAVAMDLELSLEDADPRFAAGMRARRRAAERVSLEAHEIANAHFVANQ